MDALGVHLVGLDHHLAVVLPSVHLLDVGQLQRAVVFKRSLPVVEGEQRGVFVPFYGVVRVTNDTAVNKGVPPGDGCDVFHWTDAGAA